MRCVGCDHRVFMGTRIFCVARNEHSFYFSHGECLEYSLFILRDNIHIVGTENMYGIKYNGYLLRKYARESSTYTELWDRFGLNAKSRRRDSLAIKRDMVKHGIRLGGL